MAANEQNELEWQTRRQRINPKLEAQGWTIIPWRPDLVLHGLNNTAVTESPTANGPADFALFVDGQLLEIVEAKKLSLGPQNVLTQAG